MLDALKKQASGWVAQLFIGLLVLSFAVWGVSDFFTGFRAETVASVGKTDISGIAFARQYELAVRNTSRQLGRPVTPDQAQLFGLPGQVLGRLVTQATLDDTAREFGLGISSDVLAEQIADDPAFRGPSGGFERIYFAQVLRDNGFTEDQYVENQHAVLLRQQITDALLGAASAPDPYLRALHEFRSEQRTIDYIVLSTESAGDVGEPTDGALSSYFESNKDRWRAPEYRALSLFQVTPADLANPDDVTDEEAKAAYDSDIDQYTRLERRNVSQINFDSSEEAAAAASAMAEGKSFEEIAQERSLSAEDISLGMVTRDEIIDPKIAEATFALSEGSTSDAVDGEFGSVIVRVEEIEPGEVSSFEDVKAEIKDRLALQLATRRIIGAFDEVEDARAGGETLAEIAAKMGTPFEQIAAVDQSGNDADGNPIADLPGGSELIAGAFQSDVGVENNAVRTPDNGYVWYEVTAVTAERDRTLDEVRERVLDAWKQDQIAERLTAEAEKIRDRLETGESIETVAGRSWTCG